MEFMLHVSCFSCISVLLAILMILFREAGAMRNVNFFYQCGNRIRVTRNENFKLQIDGSNWMRYGKNENECVVTFYSANVFDVLHYKVHAYQVLNCDIQVMIRHSFMDLSYSGVETYGCVQRPLINWEEVKDRYVQVSVRRNLRSSHRIDMEMDFFVRGDSDVGLGAYTTLAPVHDSISFKSGFSLVIILVLVGVGVVVVLVLIICCICCRRKARHHGQVIQQQQAYQYMVSQSAARMPANAAAMTAENTQSAMPLMASCHTYPDYPAQQVPSRGNPPVTAGQPNRLEPSAPFIPEAIDERGTYISPPSYQDAIIALRTGDQPPAYSDIEPPSKV